MWGQGQMQGTLFCKAETLLGSREGGGIPLDPSDLVLNLKLVLTKQTEKSAFGDSPPRSPALQVLPKALGGHVSEFWK